MNEKKTSRLVFDPKIARKLCKQGFVIVDIKPNRENIDKTVFVFDNTEEFKQAFDILINEAKMKQEAEAVEALAIDVD